MLFLLSLQDCCGCRFGTKSEMLDAPTAAYGTTEYCHTQREFSTQKQSIVGDPQI